jgi:hypothetical protein
LDLIMQPAKDISGQGMVVLNKLACDSQVSKYSAVPFVRLLCTGSTQSRSHKLARNPPFN